ncbi:SDR family NAD(P)-dependent oxidoreductase [Amycolatopsis sp. 195334CR]|uniref:SDR family NAD(P)-dependent oxidoreductase n=1 Tax=Amycolatopsis sp. 195334CR TaxID=2814588 RepID=UPI001A8E264D|nr:SDR family NAD(P)-dependent oxidoreductase [Amycolatopsis sp. 195334CR]MBN6038480.1 SDR family NAD(P)-dependent oxidoreductase [Amycolatopsis sp. 195334CR]
MKAETLIDTAMDRSVVLGYGKPGLWVRRHLRDWPADPPRMDGKVVLVTGAGSGIGRAAAAGFARLGASVRVLGRDGSRAREAAGLTRADAGGGEVEPVSCDISKLSELREFIDGFLDRETRLDVLVNNAGVMPDEREHTEDDVELTFATHVLAPWVLTNGLLPLLRAAAPSRVINVTSGGQYDQPIPEDDPQSEDTEYGPKKIYARTKREQLVLTEQWAEQLRADGVHVHAMHPGWADTKGVRQWLPLFRAVTRPLIRTPGQGADTIVWLGAAPDAVETTGLLWHDRRPRPTTYALAADADDTGARQQLWSHVSALATRGMSR